MPKSVTDPKERVRIACERNKGLARVIGRVFDLITRLDCMTIAAVNGHAVGGGWAIVVAFDFVLAVEEAEFWVPEVDLNQSYIGGPAHVMAARMGPWRAKEAMILCRHYTARELFEIGMVNQVVKAVELRRTGARTGAGAGAEKSQGCDRHQAFRGRRLHRSALVLNRGAAAALLDWRQAVNGALGAAHNRPRQHRRLSFIGQKPDTAQISMTFGRVAVVIRLVCEFGYVCDG